MDYSEVQTRGFLVDHAIEGNPREAFAFEGGVHQAAASFAWHSHEHHQLLYAPLGSVSVESAAKRFLLPPLRAGLIAAGVRHRTVTGSGGETNQTVSVFFTPGSLFPVEDGIHTMNSSPLLRELMTLVSQWGPEHVPNALSQSCFRTLALLCQDWVSMPVPFWLPRSDDQRIGRALRFVEEHLSTADEDGAAHAAAMSVRHFRRRFAEETGITWREYLLRARMLRGADLLGSSDRSIEDIAWDAGYHSVSAFTHAFRSFAGNAPSAYRRGR